METTQNVLKFGYDIDSVEDFEKKLEIWKKLSDLSYESNEQVTAGFSVKLLPMQTEDDINEFEVPVFASVVTGLKVEKSYKSEKIQIYNANHLIQTWSHKSPTSFLPLFPKFTPFKFRIKSKAAVIIIKFFYEKKQIKIPEFFAIGNTFYCKGQVRAIIHQDIDECNPMELFFRNKTVSNLIKNNVDSDKDVFKLNPDLKKVWMELRNIWLEKPTLRI